jgi:hypothetical protein
MVDSPLMSLASLRRFNLAFQPSCRVFGASIEPSYTAIPLPKLNVVTVEKLFCRFNRRIVILGNQAGSPYDDVRVGTIAKRSGNPHDTEPWEWRCGFYPGSRPGECTSGTAESFDEARADFGRAWNAFLSKRTEAEFHAWRDQRDWTDRKYAIWKRNERLPSQTPSSQRR